MSDQREPTWIPVGFDVRYPWCEASDWKIGDFGYQAHMQILEIQNPPPQIITMDLNECPRPVDFFAEAPERMSDPTDLSGYIETLPRAKLIADNTSKHGIDPRIFFLEIESQSYNHACSINWFTGRPVVAKRPTDSMKFLGFDILNDGANTELWIIDPYDGLWKAKPDALKSINEYGLLRDWQAVLDILPYVPRNHTDWELEPFVTIWRISEVIG